jgi:hypothetical protein
MDVLRDLVTPAGALPHETVAPAAPPAPPSGGASA